ncbi:MAG TPA: DUF6279 family lipoprotein, partial [Ramlibacter sp.]|nr:DUF6279 family lipoprotein [Ramlibacter sp.]
MSTLPRLARIIVLLTLAAGLAACSAVKLGYNSLDSVAYWWLDSYVDFNGQQAPRVREDIARLHQWHRTEELPRLAEMLHRMELLAPGDITPAQACTFVDEFRQRMRALAQQAEPAVVTLATGMQPDQVQHMEHKYEKNNEKFRDDWLRLTPAEQREKRYEQFLERSEMIYGRLDEPQREALRRDIDRSIIDPQRILADRQRRQRDALQTLRQLLDGKPDLDAARQQLRAYLVRFENPPDASY